MRIKLGPIGPAIFVLLFASPLACTKLFKERAAETPPPVEEAVDKSFFVNPDGKPKTFLCAWAPEIGQGLYGEMAMTALVNAALHCNVEFEITENYLIARRIHPSFYDDRSRWAEILKIPITKHFYYERQKDEHGRDTNTWIENDQRSHWSARPKMKLDLMNMSVHNFYPLGTHVSSSVSEIEWDFERNFLGFTTHMVSEMKGTDGELQGKFRVNFLAFDHDPNFKKIPYHQENARFMNVLHVMGRKVEGIEPELYAARWDLTKTHTIYLNGVPTEHEATVKAAFEKWNETLRKIGAIPKDHVAFQPVVKNLKHPFDLRYPSFNWISDRRLSIYSPLGIGMAHADVRNGKILWGSVNIYGGMIEDYINRYTPLESGLSGFAKTAERADDAISPIGVIAGFLPKTFSVADNFTKIDFSTRPALMNNLMTEYQSFLRSEIQRLSSNPTALARVQVEALNEQLKNIQSQNPALGMILNDLIGQATAETTTVRNYFASRKLIDHFGSSLLRHAAVDGHASEQKPNLAKLMSKIKEPSSSFFIEEGLTVANKSGSWMNSPARKTRPLPELLDSVVMDLSLHEIGHFLGLGHQFKENIVPEEGTVPSRFVKELSEKATAQNEFTNYTSVMGYRSGRVEMMIPAKDLNPGPHDELVLRYIYKGEYATYDREADDFVFARVPVSGKIPTMSQLRLQSGQVKNLPTAYFPACNDYEASLGADPFCNRWDRGSKAEDIVRSYFELVSDNLLSNLYSMVGGGANSFEAEGRLWLSSLDTFTRVRLFYDEMRRRLRSDPQLKPLWNRLRMDKDALMEFEQACFNPERIKKGSVLQEIFAVKGMIDLCRANRVALEEFRFFLNLPDADYTKIDHNKRYVSGGYLEGDADRNWGHIFGSWYQMSNLPFKISALFNLTFPQPFLMLGRGFFPNPYYDHEENRFLYRTLYPRTYTKIISDAVQQNMRFAATGLNDTTNIGRTLLMTGGFMGLSRWGTNDAAKLPREFNDLLNSQTEFQLSIVAVLIKPTKPDANSNVKADHYKKFTATVFDFVTGQSATARDVYILPKGEVFVWANGMFLYPVTKLRFYSGNDAYVIAYKVAYDYEEGDELVDESVKAALTERHNEIASLCVDGFAGNGLSSYFDIGNDGNQDAFEGFYIPPGIAEEVGKEKIGQFYKSVDQAFEKYEKWAQDRIPGKYPVKSMRRVCDEAIRGIGQIAASAALLNGYWLAITPEYLEK